MSDPLFIRADASAEIGTGHVMRCLALAQAWQERAEGGDLNTEMPEQAQVVFVCACLPEAIEQRLKKEGCEVVRIEAEPGSSEDHAQTLAIAQEYLPSTINHQPLTPRTWLVLDGYSFDMAYQRAMRAAGFKLLVVDDYNHLPEYECDILLNQNLGADTYDYKVNPEAERLLGPKYALLRREFRNARAELGARDWTVGTEPTPPEARETATHREWEGRRPSCPGSRGTGSDGENIMSPVAHHILVTMGGADLHGMTGKVVAALAQLPGPPLHIRAVTGAAAGPDESLRKRLPPTFHRIEWLRNVEDMPGLMQWADLAVSSAGSTCWELMCLGVPMLVIVLADNQEQIAIRLGQQELAVNLGWHHAWNAQGFTAAIRRLQEETAGRPAMGPAALALVDGCGTMRILATMRQESLLLRPANMTDARVLWQWANDPETRSASFSSEMIPWPDHVAWLQARLQDKHTLVFMIESAGQALGVVRFDKNEAVAVISVNLAPDVRGKGYGSHAIAMASRHCVSLWTCREIHAYIKPANTASCRAFERAGYQFDLETTIRNQRALRFAWRVKT